MSRAPLFRTIPLLAVIAPVLTAASFLGGSELPDPRLPRVQPSSAEDVAIEEQPICVGSTVRSAGVLADALFYRRARLSDGRLAIGYYAFYSDERPWGNNWLTWLFLPALAIDLIYTRTLLIAPGLQRVAYGKGDVEGFRVIYDVIHGEGGRDRLEAAEAFADDGYHRPAHLERSELFAIDPTRITVYTDVWSHQLGAKGKSAGDLVDRRCYGPGSIRPLTESLAREFHLERRALVALVAR